MAQVPISGQYRMDSHGMSLFFSLKAWVIVGASRSWLVWWKCQLPRPGAICDPCLNRWPALLRFTAGLHVPQTNDENVFQEAKRKAGVVHRWKLKVFNMFNIAWGTGCWHEIWSKKEPWAPFYHPISMGSAGDGQENPAHPQRGWQGVVVVFFLNPHRIQHGEISHLWMNFTTKWWVYQLTLEMTGIKRCSFTEDGSGSTEFDEFVEFFRKAESESQLLMCFRDFLSWGIAMDSRESHGCQQIVTNFGMAIHRYTIDFLGRNSMVLHSFPICIARPGCCWNIVLKRLRPETEWRALAVLDGDQKSSKIIFCARVANDPVKVAILTWGHMSPWSIFIIPRGPHIYWWYTIVIYMMLEPPSRQRLWITEIYHCNTWLSLPRERELK